jgi:hypothetical protein
MSSALLVDLATASEGEWIGNGQEIFLFVSRLRTKSPYMNTENPMNQASPPNESIASFGSNSSILDLGITTARQAIDAIAANPSIRVYFFLANQGEERLFKKLLAEHRARHAE